MPHDLQSRDITARAFAQWFVELFANDDDCNAFKLTAEEGEGQAIIHIRREGFEHQLTIKAHPELLGHQGSWNATYHTGGMHTTLVVAVGDENSLTPDNISRYQGLLSTIETTERAYAFYELSHWLGRQGYTTEHASPLLEVQQTGLSLGQVGYAPPGNFDLSIEFMPGESLENLRRQVENVTLEGLLEARYNRQVIKLDSSLPETLTTDLDLV